MAFLKRVKDYIHQPYEHPGEGKLVRKLGKFLDPSIMANDFILTILRFLHLDVLLFDVLLQLP